MNIPYDSPQLSAILTALSHPKRRGMVHYLSLQPTSVQRLATIYDLSLPAIHKHIRILLTANLIVRKKVGRTNFIALQPQSLAIAQAWITQYRTEWGSVHAALNNYITGL
jgi:DNA-binding transcriptional ArsR family regulator